VCIRSWLSLHAEWIGGHHANDALLASDGGTLYQDDGDESNEHGYKKRFHHD
jgi:hypothetical protein